MKNTSNRFASLKRLAEWKEKGAAARLGRERRDREEAAQRLEALRSYREEYLQRYLQAMQRAGCASRARDYQVFIEKLEYAIAEQERVLDRHADRCELAQRNWSDEYINTRSLDNLIQRKREEELQRLAKREQRQADDRSPTKG